MRSLMFVMLVGLLTIPADAGYQAKSSSRARVGLFKTTARAKASVRHRPKLFGRCCEPAGCQPACVSATAAASVREPACAPAPYCPPVMVAPQPCCPAPQPCCAPAPVIVHPAPPVVVEPAPVVEPAEPAPAVEESSHIHHHTHHHVVAAPVCQPTCAPTCNTGCGGAYGIAHARASAMARTGRRGHPGPVRHGYFEGVGWGSSASAALNACCRGRGRVKAQAVVRGAGGLYYATRLY